METKIYKIAKIEGEYATLIDESGDELFIAMALLPIGADLGDKLRYENFSFDLAE